MKAMILAAGYGKRLKPLTDKIPKALVPFQDGTMISYQINKLKKHGVKEIIVNAHHLKEKIIEYFSINNFGISIKITAEEKILGTGGGIINARDYLGSEKFFIAMNTDVYTDFDISLLTQYHEKYGKLATLAVQKRISGRYIEFDRNMVFKGRKKAGDAGENLYAFNGIHAISGEIFQLVPVTQYTDILDIYTNLSNKGQIIEGYDTGNCIFKDLGKPENLRVL